MLGPKEKPSEATSELEVTGLTQDIELPFDELDEAAVDALLGLDDESDPEDEL